MRTVDLLYDCCKNGGSLPIPVLVDYFGQCINNPKHIEILRAIYVGLIRYIGVKIEVVENCFKTGRLDELIHSLHKKRKSGYYDDFRKLGLKKDQVILH